MIRRNNFAVLLFVLALALALGLAVMTFAAVDVSNDTEPSPAERWLASGLFDLKVSGQRPSRAAREFVASEVGLEEAGSQYQQMCSFCHGATRGKMAPLAKRLSPRPPQFVIEPSRNPTWKDAYVIQHGIRWTGMPSFPGLSRSEAWELAVYVEGQSRPRE